MQKHNEKGNKQGAKESTKPAKQPSFVKKETIVKKSVIGEPPNIEFRPGQGPFKDAMTLVLSNGERNTSWVIHHPIGKTDLEAKDWVLTKTSDVPALISQQKDPEAGRLNEMRALERLRLATAAGFLQDPDDDGVFRYPNSGVERHGVYKQAQALAKAHADALVKAWEVSGSQGTKPTVSYLDFVPEPHKAEETALHTFLLKEEVQAEVNGLYPDDFRTRFGDQFDRDQAGVSWGGEDFPPPGTAYDGLVYQISRMNVMSLAKAKEIMSQPRGVTVPPAGATVTPETEGKWITASNFLKKKKGGNAKGKQKS